MEEQKTPQETPEETNQEQKQEPTAAEPVGKDLKPAESEGESKAASLKEDSQESPAEDVVSSEDSQESPKAEDSPPEAQPGSSQEAGAHEESSDLEEKGQKTADLPEKTEGGQKKGGESGPKMILDELEKESQPSGIKEEKPPEGETTTSSPQEDTPSQGTDSSQDLISDAMKRLDQLLQTIKQEKPE